MLSRKNTVVAATALLIALSGCGDSTTGLDPLDFAIVDGIVTPAEITAIPADIADFQWHAAFTVTLSESGGVGATINSVVATVNETTNGIAVITDEPVLFQLNVDSDSSRLEPNGSTQIRLDVRYTLPGGGTESAIDLSISVIDDNGAEVGGTVQARVG